MLPESRLLEICVYQQTSNAQIVGWVPAPASGMDAEDVSLLIYARYAEKAPEFLVFTGTLADRLAVITDVNLADRWRTVIYRIVLTEPGGATGVYDNIRLNEIGIYGPVKLLRRDVHAALRIGGGDPVLIYQRIVSGSRCSCYDTTLRKTINKNCVLCYGTSYTGGYYPPVLTLANITPWVKANAPGDTLRQEGATRMLLADKPIVAPRDMVYIVNTGWRGAITTVEPTSYQFMTINQAVVCDMLNPTDIEHKIPVPDLTTLVPILKRVQAPYGGRNMIKANDGEDPQVVRKNI